MIRYIRIQIPDILLAVLVSFGLILNFFSGFYLSGSIAERTYLVAIFTVFICVAVVCGLYNKITLRIMIVLLTIGALATVIILNAFGAVDLSADKENASFISGTIIVLTSVITTFLSRTRAGVLVTFSVGSFACACLAFLQYPVSRSGYIAFVLSSGVLFLYRCYTASIMKAENGNYNLKKYFAQATSVAMIALLLSVGVFMSVVAPMAPKTHELKLITKLQSFDILEVVGISSKKEIVNNTVYSDSVNEQKDTSGKRDEKEEQTQKEPEKADEKGDRQKESEKEVKAKEITYLAESYVKYIIAAVPLLLIITVILMKKLLRKRRYEKMISQSNDDAIISLYLFFVKKLKKAKLRHNDFETYGEYSRRIENEVAGFSVGEVSFEKLTFIYEKTIYGYRQVSNDELENFKTFYGEFYKNLREKMGLFKYVLKFLAI